MSGRILVTGASGLVGAASLRALAEAGREGIGMSRREIAALPGMTSLRQDLTAADAGEALARLPELSAVLHCAAEIPTRFEGDEVARVAASNERMDATVIDFCVQRRIRLVYCSSVSVYGLVTQGPVTEASAPAPRGPYAAAKLASERKIGETLVSHANLRLCAPYGSDQKSRTVMRIFVELARAGGVLQYHGSGAREQDFLHARDAARALLCAADRPTENGTFNVCSGRAISMKDLAELVVREIGAPGAAVRSSGTPDVEEHYRGRFDNSLAARRLGWRPEVSLAEGVRELARDMAS